MHTYAPMPPTKGNYPVSPQLKSTQARQSRAEPGTDRHLRLPCLVCFPCPAPALSGVHGHPPDVRQRRGPLPTRHRGPPRTEGGREAAGASPPGPPPQGIRRLQADVRGLPASIARRKVRRPKEKGMESRTGGSRLFNFGTSRGGAAHSRDHSRGHKKRPVYLG
jgi:hypothetical protein